MTPTTAALAAAAEQLRADRRSATRTLDLNLARAIARGRMPCLAAGIEDTLRRELDAQPGELADITWTAHLGQNKRAPWTPGTPLPTGALFITCTASAPLQQAAPIAPETRNVTPIPQVGDVLTVKQPGQDGDVPPDNPGHRTNP